LIIDVKGVIPLPLVLNHKNMKLTLFERMILRKILPEQSNFIELVIKNDILKKVDITQDEIKEHNIKFENDSITWENDKENDFDFTQPETELIKKQIKQLDDNSSLKGEHYDIYKKFIN
jgi:hypothetical protein